MPSLEASHLGFRLGQAVVVVGWWCCLRAAAEEVRFVRAAREVQRTHGRWWSWAGAHGAVVISVTAVRRLMLSERFQISESLAEKCEAVGRRGSHAEWSESVFSIGAAT